MYPSSLQYETISSHATAKICLWGLVINHFKYVIANQTFFIKHLTKSHGIARPFECCKCVPNKIDSRIFNRDMNCSFTRKLLLYCSYYLLSRMGLPWCLSKWYVRSSAERAPNSLLVCFSKLFWLSWYLDCSMDDQMTSFEMADKVSNHLATVCHQWNYSSLDSSGNSNPTPSHLNW